MRRFTTLLAVVGLAFGMAAAQEAQQQQRQEETSGDSAMVRFMNVAPNAAIDQVTLTREGAGLAVEDFAGTEYESTGEYVEVEPGTYEVMVTLAPAEGEDLARVVTSDSFDFAEGRFYTVAFMGLVIPADIESAEASDEGFMGWLRSLFEDDPDARGEFDLRVMVLEDEATAEVAEDETLVRIVHAAPGTQPVSLVAVGGEGGADAAETVDSVAYGEAGEYTSVDLEDRTLELRTEDGEAVILELADRDLQPGMLHTIVVAGTPVEDVPLSAVVSSTEPLVTTEREDAEPRDAAAAEPRDAAAAEPRDAAATTPREPATTPGVAEPRTPAGTVVGTPEQRDVAMVRFVHAAPNAEPEQILLTTDDAAATGITIEEFANVGYMETTDYVAIPAGTYEVAISLGAVDDAGIAYVIPSDTLNASAGNYYTIALVGLVEPDPNAEDRDEGFFAWLEGIFGGDDASGDALVLRAIVMDDELAGQVQQNEARVRIVHAAPGTESVALVVNRTPGAAVAEEDVDVVETVAYGDVSGYSTVDVVDGQLEIRIEGSQAVVVDLAGLGLESGMVHTIFVTGTPIEEMPLEAVVLSTAWAQPQ